MRKSETLAEKDDIGVCPQCHLFILFRPSFVVYNNDDDGTVKANIRHDRRTENEEAGYPHYKMIYDLFRAHQIEKALELQVKANTIMNALCDAGLIPSIKYILSTMGIDVGVARHPFRELTAEQKTQLENVVKENLQV